jgi:hypothetical protein
MDTMHGGALDWNDSQSLTAALVVQRFMRYGINRKRLRE